MACRQCASAYCSAHFRALVLLCVLRALDAGAVVLPNRTVVLSLATGAEVRRETLGPPENT